MHLCVPRLRLQGVPDAAVGGARACSALLGLIGTLVFPRLARAVGLLRTGLISIWLQVYIYYIYRLQLVCFLHELLR